MNAARDDIPKKVGRYEILEPVGFGAMGAVYKARDPLIKRIVAIKTIRLDVPPASPQYRAFIDRFYREARISGTLNHPNIITLFDIGETENKVPFLAMEFVDGEAISELLMRGEQFRPEQVIGLISQMASAIDYAHGKGVIHRDIKPSNVMIYDGEKVKIADFGIAKLADAEVTQGGTLLGTPSYMSPEQAMGENLDGRTDLFSLGVVAFEMLSGQQPFPGNNVTSILYKLVHADPVRPSNLEVLGLLPDKWHEVFNKVLAKSPADRYSTCADFVQALEMCLGSWFGSLSGETVIMASPVGDRASGSARRPAPLPPPPPAHEDRTVTLKSLSAPLSETAPSAEVEPTLRDVRPYEPYKPYKPYKKDEEEVATTVRAREATPGLAAVSGENERTVLADSATMAALDETRTTTITGVGGRADVAEAARGPLERPSTAPPTVRAAPSPGVGKSAAPRWLLPGVGLACLLVMGALALALLGGGEETDEPVEVFVPPPPEPAAPEPEPEPAAPVTGELSLTTVPDGASVSINGESRGVTPFQADLPLGTYAIRLERPGFKSVEQSVALSRDNPKVDLQPIILERVAVRPARATLAIESSPPGAAVVVDGKPSGATPLARFPVQPGTRTVRLEKEGFKPWEREIEIRAGETRSVSATLQPVEPRPAPPLARPAAPSVKEGELVTRGPGVTPPKCIKCDPASYPEIARRLRREGVVQVSFIVTETGAVDQIQVVESAGELLDQAVIEAVKNWSYEPATKQGVRVRIQLSYRQRFLRGR